MYSKALLRIDSERKCCTVVETLARNAAVEWRTAAAERAKDSVASMLSDLADLGFARRDIARLVKVSVPAVQKWRRGEGVRGESCPGGQPAGRV